MATIQVQKPQTVTTTAIAQVQSQEVVQMIIHGGLSSLSYLRGFFPEKAFMPRAYGEDDAIPSYKDYAAGRLPLETNKRKKAKGTNMQLLRRGRSHRVDTFLDWLEYGAFPAIKAGRLRALQVFVHTEPNKRSHVLESYNFTIQYSRNEEGSHIPTSIGMASDDSDIVTVGATSRALQELVRQIKSLCEHLPELPSKRYVSMAMIYNEDQSIPAGWTPVTLENLLLGEAEGWKRYEETFSSVSSKFHETSFGISYLHDNTPTSMLTQHPPTVPENLIYTYERPMPALGGLDSAEKVVEMASSEISAVFADHQLPAEPITGSAAFTSETVPTQSLAQAMVESTPAWEAAVPSRGPAITACDDTQSSNTTEMKQAFLAMMQPEEVTQGDTQSQAPFLARRPASATTASPSRGEPSPLASKSVASSSEDPKLALSQTTASRLDQQKTKKRGRAKTKSKASKRRSQEVVACQCGYMKEEGEMAECSICDTWQHLHCYGFAGPTDPRMPDEHVCYSCLLGKTESQTLHKLCELIHRRRVMQFILLEGPKKVTETAVALQMALSDTESVVDELQENGFIMAGRATKRTSASKVAYSAVKSGPKHEQMLRDLFDPLLLISHHYQTPKSSEEPSLTKRLADATTISMPPPPTPASSMRNLTRNPGPGLDTRDSVTPSGRPSKLRGRPSSGTKRPRPASRADMDDRSRVKRVQTQYLLDAGGLSSPVPPSPGASLDLR